MSSFSLPWAQHGDFNIIDTHSMEGWVKAKEYPEGQAESQGRAPLPKPEMGSRKDRPRVRRGAPDRKKG